jgi:hypothetical protein
MSKKRSARPPVTPISQQIRVYQGELAFRVWIAHLRKTGQTFAVRYWTARGYALVPTEFPPLDHEDTAA